MLVDLVMFFFMRINNDTVKKKNGYFDIPEKEGY